MENNIAAQSFKTFTVTISLMIVFLSLGNADVQQTNIKRHGTAASFLTVSPSPRISALGGIQVTGHGSSDDLYSNPASLSSLGTPDLWVAHNQSFQDTRYETLGVGLPTKRQAWGFLAQYIDEGSAERINVDAGNQLIKNLGSFDWSTTLLHTAYANRIHDRLSIGAGFKGWHEGRARSSSNGWATDVGLMAAVSRSVDLGLAYRNFGPSQDGKALPSNLAAGAAFHLSPKNVLLSRISILTEMAFHRSGETLVRCGLEYSQKFIELRTGYKNNRTGLSDPLAHFSFGTSLKVKGWRLDYAWEPKGDLGDQHRMALILALGLTPEERLEKARALDKAMESRMKDRAVKLKTEAERALRNEDWETAAAHLTQAKDWDPLDERLQKSLDELNEKIKAKKAEFHKAEGDRQAQKGQWLEAAYHWRQALSFHPSQPEVKASLELAEGRMRKLGLNAVSHQVLDGSYDKGIGHYLNGEYDKAIHEWEKVLKGDPNRSFVAAYVEKAKIKKLEEEVKSLKQEKNLTTREIDALSQKAYTLYWLGKTDSAIAVWQKILALDSENEDAKISLVEARKKKDLHLSRQGPEGVTVRELNTKAMEAYSKGDYELAASLWKKSLALHPNDQWVRNNLKRMETELAEKERSR